MARWSKQKRKQALGTTLYSGYFDFYIWADDSHVYIVISGATWRY